MSKSIQEKESIGRTQQVEDVKPFEPVSKRRRLGVGDGTPHGPPGNATERISRKSACASAARVSAADSIASKCQTSTLFVGGLHPRVADAHLQKLFQPYGKVTRVFQVRHKEGSLEGQPKGYAFVEFEIADSARAAIRRVDGRSLLGRTLLVRPAHDRTEGSTAEVGSERTDGVSKVGDARSIRREKSEVESKIEAVKRVIAEKRKGAAFVRR